MSGFAVIHDDDLAQAYAALVRLLVANGTTINVHGRRTCELTGLTMRINNSYNNILYHPDRHLNYRFMVAEWLWIWFGHNELEVISRYNSQIAQFSDNGYTLAGAYGPTFQTNLAYAIDRLNNDLYTRQAIVQIWQTPWTETKDVPCTLSIQWLLRDHRINTIVTMRSSDVWLGLPYDFFNFTMLSNCLASLFELPLGWTQLNLGSSHLYDDNLHSLQSLDANEWWSRTSPKLPSTPPAALNGCLLTGQHNHMLEEPWERYSRILHKDFIQSPLTVLRELGADKSKFCDVDPEAGKL